MKKPLLFICLIPSLAMAQNFNFSTRLGLAYYTGDLKAKSVSISQSKLLFSLGARYDLSEHLAARSYLTFTALKADDKKGNSVMKQRNLNFQSRIFEWEIGAQYNLFNLNERWWTPYVFAGIAIYHFNPYTKDTAGNKTFLKPLSTEGEGFATGVKEYKLTQFSIPFGIGAEYSLNEDMRVGLEIGYRKLFTDYIDDVSGQYVNQADLLHAKSQQAVDLAYRGYEVGAGSYPPPGTFRGNSSHRDGYYYIALTYTVRYFFDKYKQIVGLPSSKNRNGLVVRLHDNSLLFSSS